MFSIVIPSKNEEKQIGALLKSIKEQTVQPHSIILSDKSTDRTREIAKAYDVKIIEGQDDGLIGKARNKGAAVAAGEILMFVDADTELTTCTFLEDALTCFDTLELDIASCYYKPTVHNWKTFITFHIINACKWLDSFLQMGVTTGGGFIIIKKQAFKAVEGFNENVRVCEDIELVWRLLKRKYRYGVLPLNILVSSRRLGDASPLSIIISTIGGIGSTMVNVWKINWLKGHKDTFEKMYGETGGNAKR